MINDLLDLWVKTEPDIVEYDENVGTYRISYGNTIYGFDDDIGEIELNEIEGTLRFILIQTGRAWSLEWVDSVYMSYINEQGNTIQYGRSGVQCLLRSYLEDLGVELPQYTDPELKWLSGGI